MKLHFPDGKGGMNTIEVSDNISLYIENLLEDWTLETASESVKGGIKVGEGLYMIEDSLNARQYTLFPATKDSLGGVMVGDGLSITGDGVLSAQTYTLPTANETLKGGIKVGKGLEMNGDSLNATYTLPTASTSVKGGVMIGKGLKMVADTLSATYELPTASKESLGGIKVGEGLEITPYGFLNATYSLPTATRENLGGVIIGDGLTIESGVVSAQTYELPTASKTEKGGVIVGDGLDIVNGKLKATYELPTANETLKGGIKIGKGLTMHFDSLNATYSLPTASVSVKGGVKVGNGLEMNGDSLNVTLEPVQNYTILSDNNEPVSLQPIYKENPYTLEPATTESLGGVIVGDGLSITGSGKLSAKIPSLSAATYASVEGSSLGGVMIGEGLTITRRGVLSADIPNISIATEDELGVIKVGAGLNVDENGELSAKGYTLPTADTTVKGGIMVGYGLTMNNDFLDVTLQPVNNYNYTVEGGGEGLVTLQPVLVENPYSLPTANKTRLGGIKVGDGLEINSISGVLSAESYTLYPATKGTLGGIIVGKGLDVDDDGVLDVTLPTASTTKKGAIVVGNGLEMVGDTLNVTLSSGGNNYYTIEGGEGIVTLLPVVVENNYSLPAATKSSLGGVIVGDGLEIDGNGVLSAIGGDIEVTVGGGGTVSVKPYTLPTASRYTKGGIKVGSGLYMDGDSLNASSSSPVTYTLPTANETVKGGIKVGKGLYMNGDSLNAGFDSLSLTDEIIDAIINKPVEQSSSRALSVNVNKISPPGSIPPNYADEIPPLTFAIPDREPPYCAEYEVSDWAGGGLLILSAEWYYKDFKIFGDDDEEIFTTNEQTYATGWFPGDSNPPQVQIQDDEHVHVDESNIIESGINISQTKKLINGQTIIRITHYTFRHHLQQKMITAKWHSEEQTSFVTFHGSVHEELPLTAIRGSVIYKINDEKCYLYDGGKWLPL